MGSKPYIWQATMLYLDTDPYFGFHFHTGGTSCMYMHSQSVFFFFLHASISIPFTAHLLLFPAQISVCTCTHIRTYVVCLYFGLLMALIVSSTTHVQHLAKNPRLCDTGQEKLLHSGTVACLWASACSIIDHLDELLWQARSVSAVWAQKRTEKHNLHWDFPFSFSHVACDRRRSNSVEHAKKDVELTNPSHLSLISLVWALLSYLITCIWIKLPTASNFVRTTCVIV